MNWWNEKRYTERVTCFNYSIVQAKDPDSPSVSEMIMEIVECLMDRSPAVTSVYIDIVADHNGTTLKDAFAFGCHILPLIEGLGIERVHDDNEVLAALNILQTSHMHQQGEWLAIERESHQMKEHAETIIKDIRCDNSIGGEAAAEFAELLILSITHAVRLSVHTRS